MTQYQADCEREQKAALVRHFHEQTLIALIQLAALVTVVYIIGHFVIKFW